MTRIEAPERATGKPPAVFPLGLPTGLPMGPMESAQHVMVALANVCHGISEMFRLVRAYNDLTRLDHGTLREIGGRRGELDRILGGHPPRKYRDDPKTLGAPWMASHKEKGQSTFRH